MFPQNWIRGNTLWSVNDAIFFTAVNAAMLEVYNVSSTSVVFLRVLASYCVWNYATVEMHGFTNNLVQKFSEFTHNVTHFNSVFVYAKYTFNVAACYDVNDVIAAHVLPK